jgi:amino acid transporter
MSIPAPHGPHTHPPLPDPLPSAEGLKPTLGLAALIFYGVGSMLGAGIYGLIGEAARTVGSAVWLAFAVAMVAALLTGLTYASLVSRYPRAGGAAYITRQAFKSPLLAFVIGICVLASGMTSMATSSNVFARNFVAFPYLDSLSQAWVAGGVIVAMGLVNFWGLRESAALNTLCTIVEASGLLIIIAIGASYWGSRSLLEFPPSAEPSQQGPLLLATGVVIMQGAVLTFFSFIGFEDLLNVSEEAKDATRTVPRALIVAQLITVTIYMLVAITAVSVLPWQELAASKTPLADVAARAASWFPSWLISAVTCFAVLNTSLLNYVMGSRLVYGMSRDGLLPRFLSHLNAWRRTPIVAIILVGLAVLSLRLVGDISQTGTATVLLLLIVFITMHLSLAKILLSRTDTARAPRAPFHTPLIVPILGSLVCLSLIVARYSDPKSAPSLYIAGGIVIGAVVLHLLMRLLSPKISAPPP